MPIKIPNLIGRPQAVIALRDIGAGANLKANPFVIPPNQMRRLENCYLVEDGSLLGRRGTSRWNAATLGAGAVLGGFRASFTGNNHFLAAHAGTIWKGTDATKTFASSLTGLNASSPIWFTQYLNFVYAANRLDAQRKWDGTSWTAMGVAAPGTGPTAAIGAGGVLNGTYTFKVTFVTPTIESNESPASGSVAPVNQQVDLTAIPTGPAGVTKRRIYGFKTGVSSVYQLIGEINDNVTTTFTVTTDQPSWTTAIPTTNNPPVIGPWLWTPFKNRLWAGGDPSFPRRLYFSQIFVPEALPITFFVDIPFEYGDEITALFVLGDLLLVFGHNSVYYVIGDTPFSFIVKKSYAVAGCPSPWAVDRIENAAAYLSRFGVLAFDGAQSRILTDPIDPQFTGLFQAIQSLNYAVSDKTALRYYDRLKAFIVTFAAGASTVNDTTWWYFLRRPGWVKDTRAARLFLVTNGKGDTGDLYAFDANDGILRQWDPTGVYTDDGVAITARWNTGVHTGEHPLAAKPWLWYTLRARPASITVQVTADLDQGVETDSFSISLARGAVYGTGLYGTATYAAEFDDFEERFDAKMRGRGIALNHAAPYSEFFQVVQMFLTHGAPVGVRRRVGVTP